jgi:hypothetical protein
VISSRRRDQIPDPDADGTPGIASSPSPPYSTQPGPRARSVAHPIPAAEDHGDDSSAFGPRRMRRRPGPPSCGRVGSTAAVAGAARAEKVSARPGGGGDATRGEVKGVRGREEDGEEGGGDKDEMGRERDDAVRVFNRRG